MFLLFLLVLLLLLVLVLVLALDVLVVLIVLIVLVLVFLLLLLVVVVDDSLGFVYPFSPNYKSIFLPSIVKGLEIRARKAQSTISTTS